MSEFRASWGSKLTYSMGSVAYGVKDSGFSTFMVVYFNQVLGLPALYVGIALLLALAVDAISDPYVGHISDKWQSKLGRRHPFMYAAIIPAVLVYFWIWNPPENLTEFSLFLYLTILAILVRLLITFFEVPNSAMVAELDPTYDGQTHLAGLRSMIAWIGGVVMAVIAYSVFLVPVGDVPGVLNKQGYQQLAYLGSAAMAIAMIISSVGTHRLITHLPQPDQSSNGYQFGFRTNIKTILSQKSFRAVFLGSLFSNMVFGITITLQVYFATFFFGLTSAELGLVALTFVPAAICAFALTSWLSKKTEKRALAIGLTYACIVTANIAILFKYVGLFPPAGHPLVFPLLCLNGFVSMLFVVALSIVLLSMTADLVEETERKTGHRSEGLYFATFSFTRKVVTGVGIFSSGVLLSLGGERVMTEGRMNDIALPYMALIAALYVASLSFLRNFDLTRERHATNLKQVNATQSTSADP